MASACVNNVGVSPENLKFAYGWLRPRVSLGREEEARKASGSGAGGESGRSSRGDEKEIQESVEFEFRLEEPVAMQPADELFADGKLLPLQVPGATQPVKGSSEVMKLPEEEKCRTVVEMEISAADAYLFSPKAPRCSSRWRELLGLKKVPHNGKSEVNTKPTSSSFSAASSKTSSSLKHFLHRSSKSLPSSSNSSSDVLSLSLPLLKDPDAESLSVSSSRLSLSSSSSGHEHDDHPRLSLDSERPSSMTANIDPNPFAPARSLHPNPPRMRLVKPRLSSDGNQAGVGGVRVGRSPMRRSVGEASIAIMSRGASVDSPRLNSSGKIVFQSLERSSSSPSSFNGGPGYRHRGMERSYSANVRVTPVLNVPLCSLRGGPKSGLFGQLFASSSSSQQKNGTGANRGHQQSSSKIRIERT